MNYCSDKNLLYASSCSCGGVYFPQVHVCRKCGNTKLETIKLSRKGKVYGFTVVRRQKLAVEPFQVPYIFGYVDLPEGIRVMSHISAQTIDEVKVGSSVHLTPQANTFSDYDFGFKLLEEVVS